MRLEDDTSDEFILRHLNRFFLVDPKFSERFPRYFDPNDGLPDMDRHMQYMFDRVDHVNERDGLVLGPR